MIKTEPPKPIDDKVYAICSNCVGIAEKKFGLLLACWTRGMMVNCDKCKKYRRGAYYRLTDKEDK